jgi:chromosome transmission fidelity protein 4
MRRCSRDVPCLSATLLFRQTAIGLRSPASKLSVIYIVLLELTIASELTIKVVNTKDTDKVLYIRNQPKPTKHVSFDRNGSYLAASCTNGIVYIYSLSTEQPELIKEVDGLIRALETDAEASSRAIWHPDGRAFAAPTATRDIQVVSRSDGERQKKFSGGHMGDVTALAWAPNGSLLLTAGADQKLMLWETKTQSVVARYDYPNIINLAWHPSENMAAFTTSDGEVYIYPGVVPSEKAELLEDNIHPAPFIHDPLAETSGNARKVLTNGVKESLNIRKKRQGTPDTLDDILGSDLGDGDEDDFVEDDDGAGYAFGLKRTNGHLDDIDDLDPKRRATYASWSPRIHQPFQPGSTPWRGNRRYLCLNLTGFVWTVDQDTHHTVTVEFYDREFHRDFHFTDPYLYDKACLNETGTLFSCPPANGNPAMIFYRPHETWTARVDWRTSLPAGEDVVCKSTQPK